MGSVCVEPWMIRLWPVREWYMPEDPAEWPAWWHMGTRVEAPHENAEHWRGDTVWAATVDGVEVAASWAWTEVRPGVVVLSDPNAIASNLRCRGASAPDDERLAAIVALNRLTHELPWRETVCSILRMLRRHAGIAAPAAPRVRRSRTPSMPC